MLPPRTLLNPPPVGELLTELAAFGERVVRLLADATVDWSRRPAEGEWSLTEIACHLRDVEREVHQARFSAYSKTTAPSCLASMPTNGP